MEFLMENAFMISYGVVVLLSILTYSRYFDTPLKYLPVVFFYTLLTELLGGIILVNEDWRFFGDEILHYYNMVIYNIYSIIFFLYFFYIFYVYMARRDFRRIVLGGTVAFLLASAINPFFQSFLFTSQTYAYVLGTLVLLGSIVLYWVDTNRIASPLPWKNNLLIWLSIGLFMFYAAYLPIEIYRYYNLLYNGSEPAYVRGLVRGLIVLMNLIFCIGFLYMRSKPLAVKR